MLPCTPRDKKTLSRRTCKTMIWKVRIRITLSTSSHTFLFATFGTLSVIEVLIGVRSSLQACHQFK